jgi:hypothetical protein
MITEGYDSCGIYSSIRLPMDSLWPIAGAAKADGVSPAGIQRDGGIVFLVLRAVDERHHAPSGREDRLPGLRP